MKIWLFSIQERSTNHEINLIKIVFTSDGSEVSSWEYIYFFLFYWSTSQHWPFYWPVWHKGMNYMMCFICKMIRAGWASNNQLMSNKQDGKSVQRGQISLSVLQHNLWLSQNKLGPRVRWERPHLRLPLPGWMPDVPRLSNGHGKHGLWTGSVILEQWHVFVVPSLQRMRATLCCVSYALNSAFPSTLWRVCTTCLSSAQRLYWISEPSLKLPEMVPSPSLFESADLLGSV